MKKTVLAIGTLAGSVIAIAGAWGVGERVFENRRPWAIRETEMVVAGFQLDRYASDVRDIDARIFRLENKQKLYPRMWTREDEAELYYWRNERVKLQQRIDLIRQQQRPMYVR